jgi:hypothetical protein
MSALRRGVDKPHIAWSKYWGCYAVTFMGLTRLGSTAVAAWHAYTAARRAGAKR